MAQLFTISINGVNVDSYVKNDGACDISICERNRDYTLIVPGFELVLKHSAPSYSVGHLVLVSAYGSSYPFFIGVVVKRRWVEALKSYAYEIEGLLKKLQDYYVTYSELHSLLSGGTSDLSKYNPSDAEGYPNVRIAYVVEQMFNTATGKTIDLSDILETTLETKEPIPGGGNKTFKIKHLCMDENMLYCINNEVACAGSVIEANSDYLKNIWTFFQFVSFFFSSVKIVGRWSQIGTAQQFKVYNFNDTPYSYPDADIYKKVDDVLYNPNSGVNLKFYYSSARVDYTSGTPIALGSYAQVNTGELYIDHPANLLLSYRDLRYPESDGKMYPISGFPNTCYAILDSTYGRYMLEGKYKAMNVNHTTYLLEGKWPNTNPYSNYTKVQINPKLGVRSKYYHEVPW